MRFLPLDKMWDRVYIAKDASDTDFSRYLMYCGEMIVKLATAGFVAAIETESDRHRYPQVHRLIRADGLGEWDQVLNDTLTGPPSQALATAAYEEQAELTSKSKPGTWQYEALSLIHGCLQQDLRPDIDPLPTKIDGRRWFSPHLCC